MNTLADIKFVSLADIQLGVSYFVCGYSSRNPVFKPGLEIKFTNIKRNRFGPVGSWVARVAFSRGVGADTWSVNPKLFDGELRLSADPVPAYLIGAMLMTQKLEDSIGTGAPLERTATEAQMIADIWSKKLLAEFQKSVSFIGDKQQ